MGLFGKLFGGGGPPKPPRWAAPFGTLARFDAFIEWLQEELENRGIPQLSKVLRSGGFVVKLPKKDVTLVLEGLARACAESDDAVTWARHLDGFLTERIGGKRLGEAGPVVLRPPPSLPAATLAAPAFEAVAEQLKVQLHGPASLAGLGPAPAELVAVDLAPGLTAVLVWDKGATEQLVPRRFAEAWGRSAADLVDLAWENVRRTEPVEIQTVEASPGLTGQLVVGPGHYVAAFTARVRPPEGERWHDGVLLALPSRHSALFHPLKSGPQSLEAYAWLAGVARKLHDEYDDPVSDCVWWREGERYLALPARLVPGPDGAPRLELAPPPEFVGRFLPPGVGPWSSPSQPPAGAEPG